MKRVKARKDEVVRRLAPRHRDLARRHGALHRLSRATPASKAAHALSINGETIEAERIFLNVGGRAVVPDMPGLDQVDYLTNTSILELDALPGHSSIVGGSYIGLEFAQMYRRFGAEVTVIETRAAPDRAARTRTFRRRSRTSWKARASRSTSTPSASAFRAAPATTLPCVDRAPASRRCRARMCCWRSAGGPTPTISASTRPASTTDARGYIVVDDQLRTNVPGIWAMGDCNGKGAFTHTSYNDFEIVAANLLDNDPRRVSDRITTYALYIDPPLGRAGHDRDGRAQVGPQGAGRHAADDARRPRRREGRDARLHEGAGRRRDARRSSAPRSSASAATRRSTASST